MADTTTTKPMRAAGKTYASVLDLVRDTGDEQFAEEYQQYASERQLVDALTVLRGVKGVTQSDLAERMKCGQSKVSKMESSTDAELNMGDFVSYALSLGHTVRISLSPGQASGADNIRFHMTCLKREFERLVRHAGKDNAIAEGVEKLVLDTASGLFAMVDDLLSKLPNRAQRSSAPVKVEVQGDRGECISLDTPRPARRPKSKSKTTSVG